MDLTAYQAYRAMYHFLSEVYDTLDNDTLGALLNALSLERDGLPKNKHLKHDWTALCVSSGKSAFTLQETWYLMEEFLRAAAIATDTLAMDKLISWVSLHEHDAEVQSTWDESMERAAAEKEDWED